MFTEVEPDTFDVLETGKRRNAADVAIEGEKSTILLAAMVRTVWLYRNRPDATWSGSYLVEQANKKAQLDDWYGGIIDGAGLAKTDPRLIFRRAMLALARKQAGVVQRRRDTRGHLVLYVKAFNAWASGETLPSLRFAARESVPTVTKIT